MHVIYAIELPNSKAPTASSVSTTYVLLAKSFIVLRDMP